MVSTPFGVESVSVLPISRPGVNRAMVTVTPSPSCLRPSKDMVYLSQLSGLEAPLRWSYPYEFLPRPGIEPRTYNVAVQCANHYTTGATAKYK